MDYSTERIASPTSFTNTDSAPSAFHSLPPILQRMGLEPQTWLNSLLELFRLKLHPPPSPVGVLNG